MINLNILAAKKYEKVEEHIEYFFALDQKLKVENAELKELYMAEVNDNKN